MTEIGVSSLGWRVGKNNILKDIHLRVTPGSVFCIIGPSGGGKTSLLRSIAGIINNYSGTVCFNGVSVDSLPPERRGAVMLRQPGMLFPHLTVRENISFGLKIRHTNAAEIRERVDEYLALIRLAERAASYPHELSAGQVQRAALAMALVIKPAALLLDEPFSNLDPSLHSDIRAEILAILCNAGITAIIATHDWEDAFLMGDTVALMFKGELIPLNGDGTPELPPETDHEAVHYLRGLRVVEGVIKDGCFTAPNGICIPTAVSDRRCRALVTRDGVRLIF
jgi:ABC-type Fe3+/spermidine/putrescine transport system ATPase subunit